MCFNVNNLCILYCIKLLSTTDFINMSNFNVMNVSQQKTAERLRIFILIAAIAGAIASVWLTIYMGRQNPSHLLIAAFIVWVVSPFVAYIFTILTSGRWVLKIRYIFYALVLFSEVVSILFYSRVIVLSSKTAFAFLVIPFISWVLLAMTIFLARSSTVEHK